MRDHPAGPTRDRANHESYARGTPSMLLDSISPDDVFSIETMGRGMPRRPMDSVHYPVPSISHRSEAGKSL